MSIKPTIPKQPDPIRSRYRNAVMNLKCFGDGRAEVSGAQRRDNPRPWRTIECQGGGYQGS